MEREFIEKVREFFPEEEEMRILEEEEKGIGLPEMSLEEVLAKMDFHEYLDRFGKGEVIEPSSFKTLK